MAKGFMDRLLVFMGIQEESVDEAAQPAPERPVRHGEGMERRGSGLYSVEGRNGDVTLLDPDGMPTTEVAVIRPRRFEDVELAAGILKGSRPAVVSLEGCDRELARRIVDFLSGATYALEGHMRRLADDIFLFTPRHIPIGEENEAAASREDSHAG